jgi:hypothetical protein
LCLFVAVIFGERAGKSQVETRMKQKKSTWDFPRLKGTVMNLKEIAYSHYLPAKRKRRRANTCEGHASELRLYVIPRFGRLHHCRRM